MTTQPQAFTPQQYQEAQTELGYLQAIANPKDIEGNSDNLLSFDDKIKALKTSSKD